MVKHSLMKLLDKYPYFLDKRNISNLYKITKVNNSLFQELYNNLFHTYENFHINKRLLVWRTQEEPYIYQNHFCCSYPNIKSVKIYKDDLVIHNNEFREEANKGDYDWVYECEYYQSNMLPLNMYRCSHCEDGEIYYGEPPRTCQECGENTFITVHAYKCDECGEIYYTNPNEDGEINIKCDNDDSTSFTEVYAFKCLGNEYSIVEEEDGSITITTDCGELYLAEKPPVTCSNCGHTGYTYETELYLSEDIILLKDNSTVYNDMETITVTEDTTINPIYNKIVVDIPITNENEEKEVKLLSKINDNEFKFYVETWDEYWEMKGYPENDTFQDNIFDHDYSLDELGALNNIPRKEYIIISNEDLYPLTEPPYNKQATEDDYHYMKRMVEYNLKQWNTLKLLELSDEDYDNYIKFLNQIGISEEDYNIYKNNTRLFRERHNPVSLELWKNYSVSSRLVNREHKLLKLFDLRKHNDSYIPYKTDEDGNRLMDSNGNYIPKDEWEVVTDLSEDWIPSEWEHKDKFCDGTQLYGEYLYITASTLRPVPYENVDVKFILLNSLGEPVNEDYYVNLYYFRDDKSQIRRLGSRDISNGETTISFKIISTEIPTTIRAVAYKSDDDEFIDCCDVTFNPRNCRNADLYVDAEPYGYEFLTTDYFINTANWSTPPTKNENNELSFTKYSELLWELSDNSVLTFNIMDGEDSEQLGLKFTDYNIFFDDSDTTGLIIETIDGVCHIYYYEDGEKNYYGTVNGLLGIVVSPYTKNTFSLSDFSYTDYNFVNYEGDGSAEHPFLNLQDALNRINQNFDVIALKSNLKIDTPLFVSNTCKILGCRNSNNNVPIITNTTNNKFFKLIGGKKCNLTLVDLRLKYRKTNNYIGISSWTNNNEQIDNYTSVITSGGIAIITISLDKTEYYPIDTIHITGMVKDKKDKVLSNQDVELYFDNELITTLTSDENGRLDYYFNINKTHTDIYNLELRLVSEGFFPTTQIVKVNCTISPVSYNVELGDEVTIRCENHEDYEGETLTVVIDGVETTDTVTVTDGVILYDYTAHMGKHTIVFVDEDGRIVDVVFVETTIPLSILNNTTFIKNINIASDSTLSYETITVTNNSVLGDLNGIVSSVKMNGVFLDINVFNVDESRSSETYILATECEKLADCLISLEYDNETTIISYDILGNFWEND